MNDLALGRKLFKKIKETVVVLQARSMRDNVLFSGFSETFHPDSPETDNVVKTISFHHAHFWRVNEVMDADSKQF